MCQTSMRTLAPHMLSVAAPPASDWTERFFFFFFFGALFFCFCLTTVPCFIGVLSTVPLLSVPRSLLPFLRLLPSLAPQFGQFNQEAMHPWACLLFHHAVTVSRERYSFIGFLSLSLCHPIVPPIPPPLIPPPTPSISPSSFILYLFLSPQISPSFRGRFSPLGCTSLAPLPPSSSSRSMSPPNRSPTFTAANKGTQQSNVL